MSTTVGFEKIKSAKKEHICSWCNQKIEIHSSYYRWRFFDYGDAGTCKIHPECYDAMDELRKIDSSWDGEFTPGENPRGCNCGFDKYCTNCHPEK